MNSDILNKYFKMFEVLNLINSNIGYEKIKGIYIGNDVYELLDSIEIILDNNVYLYSITLENLNDLYLLFDYYRFTYKNKNQLIINKCNKLIKLLNYKIFELNELLRKVENKKIDYYEIINACYNKNIYKINNNFSIVSFNVIKKIWESEYYLVKYLLNKKLLDINIDYLLNSAFIEFGILHLRSFYELNEEDKVKLNALLLGRMKNRKKIYKLDVYNIFINKKEVKLLINKLIEIINNDSKILKKDK